MLIKYMIIVKKKRDWFFFFSFESIDFGLICKKMIYLPLLNREIAF